MPRYAGQDYDMSSVFFAEEGERGPDEVNLAEEDSFELGVDKTLG